MESSALRPCQILLVDDNELIREMESAMLEPYDLPVVEAESGTQAVALVRETAFDLIFLDYLMPGMDGLETAAQIRTVCEPLGRQPVIIALTAEESPEVIEAFHAKGCQAVLAKPMDEEKLQQTLERWCGVAGVPRSEGMTDEELSAIQIPGIDQIPRQKTRAQYLELLSLYRADGCQQLEVWQSVSRERLKDYRIWVHALKSASANIGAMALSQQARAQEMAAKEEDYPTVEAGFPPLMDAYRKLLEDIGACLQDSQGPQITAPALPAEELKARLEKALELLEDFRSEDCAHMVGELLHHPLPEGVEALLRDARDKLSLYQDDDAEAVLRRAVDAA